MIGNFLHCMQICCEVMLHTLISNNFFLCLRVNFHKSLVWVPVLAAGGPYFKAWGPLTISSWHSGNGGIIVKGEGSIKISIQGCRLWAFVHKSSLRRPSIIFFPLQISDSSRKRKTNVAMAGLSKVRQKFLQFSIVIFQDKYLTPPSQKNTNLSCGPAQCNIKIS